MLAGGASSAVAADNCSNAEFRVGPSALLPDCRAYELVSMADKGAYGLVNPGSGSTGAFPSESGDQAAYGVLMPLPGALNGNASMFAAAREADGWKGRPMIPAVCRGVEQSGTTAGPWVVDSWSLDLSVNILRARDHNNCDPNDHAGMDLYRYTGGEPVWLSHNGTPKTVDESAQFEASSADASHVVFRTGASWRLMMPLEAGLVQGNGLYERVGDQLRAVGLKTDGSLINPCGARIAGAESSPDTTGKISDDGRVIFFHSGSSTTVAGCSPTTDHGGQLYARIDASRTVLISASQRTVADTRRQPVFMSASRDGRTAYFTSTEMLTDDATPSGGLYAYDLGPVLDGTAAAGTLRFLTPALTAAAANIQGRHLAGMSDDGSRVYFLANGVLHPDAPATGTKLYAYDNGQIHFVVPFVGSVNVPAERISVSADGSKATGLYRPAGYTTDQIFLYDLAGTGVTCVSCVAGVTPTGHASLQAQVRRPAPLGPRRNVTNDGMVFFESRDRLVARDTNDETDVYRYADGELRLISGGTGTMGSFLAGTTASGRDVFFVTNDSLLPEDFDNGDQDLYVARVGGGFPQPTGAAAPCVGDACQGTAPGAPGVNLPGSSIFGGAGNLTMPAESGDASVTKLTLLSDRRSVRGTSARVRVRVSGKGRVRTSGSGVRQSTRNVSRAGTTYRVPVRLSTRAKRTLNRRGRVQVRVTVRFTPADGRRRSTRVRMTFRRAVKSSSRSKATRSKSRAGERAAFAASVSRAKGGR